MRKTVFFAAALLGCGAPAPEPNDPIEQSVAPSPPESAAPGAAQFTTTTPSASGAGQAAPDANSSVAVCDTQTFVAQRMPLHMVVVFDRSLSMCGDPGDTLGRSDCTRATAKLTQARLALKTFFGAAQSAGMSASLFLFPAPGRDYCDATEYATPVVSDAALPNTSTLVSAIDGIVAAGNTPTQAALTGAIQYASGVRTRTNKPVAVVMVTDGYPEGCSDSGDVSQAAQVARGAAATVPTYVVGLGDRLSNLHQLAAAGGTTQAHLISSTNPGGVTAGLIGALSSIRGVDVTCEYKLPQTINGKVPEMSTLQVQTKSPAGAVASLNRDDACTAGGWHFDDPLQPKKVLLCANACSSLRANPTSEVTFTIGCKTPTAPTPSTPSASR